MLPTDPLLLAHQIQHAGSVFLLLAAMAAVAAQPGSRATRIPSLAATFLLATALAGLYLGLAAGAPAGLASRGLPASVLLGGLIAAALSGPRRLALAFFPEAESPDPRLPFFSYRLRKTLPRVAPARTGNPIVSGLLPESEEESCSSSC